MANSRTSEAYREEATVDTTPGASGYYTNLINPRQLFKDKGIDKTFFNVRGGGAMVVTLQFQAPGESTWYDYASYDSPTVVELPDLRTGMKWRAGVKNDTDYTSGEFVFGFNF